MNQPFRSRSIVVSILTTTLVTIAGLFLFSNHLSSASSSSPAISRLDRLHPPRPFLRKLFGTAKPDDYDDGEHVLAVPYYNLTGGWTSTVMLSNQAPTQVEVGITLFSLDGQ